MKTKLMIVILAALVAVCAFPAWAQMVTVKGKITDGGQPVVGATVELRSSESGRRYALKTDKKGEFYSIGVMTGQYDLAINKDGQVIYRQQFTVTYQQDKNTLDIDIAKARAEQQKGSDEGLSAAQKAERDKIAKENEKIAGLNNMVAASNAAATAGNYEEAIKLLNQVVQTDATRDVVWARLGDLNMAAGKAPGVEHSKALEFFNGAADAYQKAIAIKPTGGYYSRLGDAYFRAGKMPEAMQQYELAAQNDPTNAAMYYFNLGAVLTNSGKPDEANAAFDKAIAADPKYVDAYLQKAINLMSKGTYNEKTGTTVYPPEVADSLNKCLEIAPDGPKAATAKELLAQIGAKVETNFGSKKGTTNKK